SEVKNLYNSLRENRFAEMSYSNGLKASLSAEILREDKVVGDYSFKPNEVIVIDSQNTFKGE
ncbi:MAG: hypothetical protein ACKO7B_02780, partial [Flavobacteriales bacterium]